jgi:hypothetical protein
MGGIINASRVLKGKDVRDLSGEVGTDGRIVL